MNFKEAFELMKDGAKVRLPSWGKSYAYWDEELETIMFQLVPVSNDTRLIDASKTPFKTDYDALKIICGEWVVVEEQTFSFGDAVKYLKRGLKVARKGWNGKGMYLFLCFPASIKPKAENVEIYSARQSVAMRTADGTVVVGWVPTQVDMLAEDWVFVE